MVEVTARHLERLVSFNTVSHAPNAELIAYAADHLRAHGAEVALLPDASGGKIGLHATIGPHVPGGVVLSGHTDVVAVEGQAWTSDPFRLRYRDGRYYGRGAADMKGFLAACLTMAPKMSRAGLKRPIHFVMSYDEETTCRGVLPTIADITARFPEIAAVIVGEPTGMKPANAHKGAYGYKVRVAGRAAHSSLADQGVSATALAARLITWLDDRMRENAARASGTAFRPNYTTCHAGTIQGGLACNILAADCAFEWDLRTLPEDDPVAFLAAFRRYAEALLADARRVAPDCRIDIEEDYAVPGLRPEPGGAAEALCRRLTGANESTTVSYSSEAGQFQSAGLSTVLVGPGSIDQAHIADEYVEASQLAACEAFLGRIIEAQAQ
jgi:acetylornithine deacetylase